MPETSWQFYTQTDQAWQAMLFEMEQAERSIDLEMYVMTNDDIGGRFLGTLMLKARKGLRVRLHLDCAGSVGLYNSVIIRELQKSGVQVQFYNPISPWRLRNITSWYWRNHRKLLIIDELVAFTGGVGIEQVMSGWRDTEVRVTGNVVNEMQYAFNRMWQITDEGRFRRFRHDRRSDSDFRFWTNSPHFRQRFFYQRLVRTINRARNYVYLTTPYFIPNQRLLFALARAARRGVDVRLITPQRSDHPFVDLARSSYYTLAMKAGIKIYHFQDRILHAKTAVIDDHWATVGSANLDNLSLLFNYEANLVSCNTDFVSEVKHIFINDLLAARELQQADWQQRSRFTKFLELLTWPFHGLM